MERLRVCRVVDSMWVGGVQQRLIEFLPRLREHGWDPHVVVLRGQGELLARLEKADIPCTVLGDARRIATPGILPLRRLFRQHAFHVVHTHHQPANVAGTLAARLAGVPCIVSQLHDLPAYAHRRQALVDRTLLPLRDRLLTSCRAIRQSAARELAVDEERLQVIHDGINLAPPPTRPRARLLDDLRLPSDTVLIVHVARLHEHKNHRAFLDEFPRVLKIVPNARLLLVGTGREHAVIEQRIRELGLQAQARLLGQRDDVADLLAAADISILPSTREGFSSVILESMLHRAVVVATDVGGAREQVRDGVDGYLVPAGDRTAFRELVIKLAVNPSLRRKLAESAARRVREYDVDRMVAETLTLYETILRAKKRWPGQEKGSPSQPVADADTA
ncbi:MAG: glycosyltransferase [Candidatus Sumerlaeia bacterium]|nr:glycosyltransferase [Candidatus Sumerlaeia bacterium]